MGLKPLTPPDKTFYRQTDAPNDYERCEEKDAEIVLRTFPRSDQGYNKFFAASDVTTQEKIGSISDLPLAIVSDANLSKEKQEAEDNKNRQEREDFERRWELAKQQKHQ